MRQSKPVEDRNFKRLIVVDGIKNEVFKKFMNTNGIRLEEMENIKGIA